MKKLLLILILTFMVTSCGIEPNPQVLSSETPTVLKPSTIAISQPSTIIPTPTPKLANIKVTETLSPVPIQESPELELSENKLHRIAYGKLGFISWSNDSSRIFYYDGSTRWEYNLKTKDSSQGSTPTPRPTTYIALEDVRRLIPDDAFPVAISPSQEKVIFTILISPTPTPYPWESSGRGEFRRASDGWPATLWMLDKGRTHLMGQANNCFYTSYWSIDEHVVVISNRTVLLPDACKDDPQAWYFDLESDRFLSLFQRSEYPKELIIDSLSVSGRKLVYKEDNTFHLLDLINLKISEITFSNPIRKTYWKTDDELIITFVINKSQNLSCGLGILNLVTGKYLSIIDESNVEIDNCVVLPSPSPDGKWLAYVTINPLTEFGYLWLVAIKK